MNRWLFSQEKLLINNYEASTIQELCELLNKSKNEINCKIERLKKQKKIKTNRTEDTVKRSYKQR